MTRVAQLPHLERLRLPFGCAQGERQHGTPDLLCAVFLRGAQKNRTLKIIVYRSAEGKKLEG